MTDLNFKKVCIPYEDHPRGGMYTFLRYFTQYLEENGVKVTRSLWGSYDVLFINSFMTPPWKVRLIKILKPKVKLVHRIDGAAQDYGRGIEWDYFQRSINKISDLTIFQSEYGKKKTKELDVIKNNGPIIYNGVDVDKFYADYSSRIESSKNPIFCYVTFSKNPMKGGAEVINIAKEFPQYKFKLIGHYENEEKLPNIEYLGFVNPADLPCVLNQCHYFLFYSQNETCPNVVLEAMASGLVVLYLNSGGTHELVGDDSLAITSTSLKSCLGSVISEWESISKRLRRRVENNFSIENICSQYLSEINSLFLNEN